MYVLSSWMETLGAIAHGKGENQWLVVQQRWDTHAPTMWHNQAACVCIKCHDLYVIQHVFIYDMFLFHLCVLLKVMLGGIIS